MGTFTYTISLGTPDGSRFDRVEALVDSGASYTTVPASLLRNLGVPPHARWSFVLADGREVERDVGRTWIRVDGRQEITLVVFGGEGTQPLLGVYTLEGVRLGIDPVNRRLTPVTGLLMQLNHHRSIDLSRPRVPMIPRSPLKVKMSVKAITKTCLPTFLSDI